LHVIVDRKTAAFNTDYLAQGVGQHFGAWESEAQAERRRERSRSGTTIAELMAEARRSFGIKMPFVTDALFCGTEPARSGGDLAEQRPVKWSRKASWSRR